MTRTPLLEALAVLICLSALSLVVGLTGCADYRCNQSRGHRIDVNRAVESGYDQGTEQRIEDSRTAERVREALAAGADYRYDGVKVIAWDGGIQLSGFVKTSAQKHSAGEVASQVAGVRGVENKLMVKD